MTGEDRNQLASILFGLAGNFGDTIDKHTINIWCKAFAEDGINIDQIRKAAGRILRTRKISKMPTYAEFIEHIHGDAKDKAQRQSDIVLDFLRKNGARAEPEFDDPVTAYLMQNRWPYKSWAASLKEAEVVWWRKEFIEAYQSYAKRPDAIPADRQIEAGEKVKQLACGIGG
jgi:hypothetical protein